MTPEDYRRDPARAAKIAQIVSEAPPLTEAQIARLRRLFTPPPAVPAGRRGTS